MGLAVETDSGRIDLHVSKAVLHKYPGGVIAPDAEKRTRSFITFSAIKPAMFTGSLADEYGGA